ncbi:MAG: aminotransferase class I/II-fold pyridoxal phosphate-dependent enzyme [Arthrobacter sp.]|jgi:cystathionine beta-lyase|nr:aminotransferase class I/II-fold pyridoxal phosphate-dependent enzyme [Arthrobacter sp.]
MTAVAPRIDPLHAAWDSIDEAELRRRHSLKWSDVPEAMGAFIAEADFGTAPAVDAALRDVIDRAGYGYLPRWLVGELREAYCSFAAQRYGTAVDPERVQILPDVLAGLEHAITFLTAPGTPVVVPTPAYMPFLEIPRRLGRDIIEVPMRHDAAGWRLDLAGIDGALGAGAGLVILCNPHNPTGHVASLEELHGLGDVVERHQGVRVFVDEIHAPVVLSPAKHVPYASLGEREAAQAITATSTSKAFALPGLKCAQLILSNDDDLAGWARDGERAGKLASTVGAAANVAAYREGGPWLDSLLGYLESLRSDLDTLMARELPGLGYDSPDGTYIAWIDCSALGLNESPAAFFLREAGVAVSDGAACGNGFEQHVRLVFATPRPVLRGMLERMGAAVRRHVEAG